MAIVFSTALGALGAFGYRHVKQRLDFPIVFTCAFGLMGCGYLIIAQATSYSSVIFGLLFSGLGTGLMMPNGTLWLISSVPAHIRGRYVGILTMCIFMGQFCSPIACVPLIRSYSLQTAFSVAGILLGFLALLFLVFNGRLVQLGANRTRQ